MYIMTITILDKFNSSIHEMESRMYTKIFVSQDSNKLWKRLTLIKDSLGPFEEIEDYSICYVDENNIQDVVSIMWMKFLFY